MALFLGFFLHLSHVRMAQMGKDAYLAKRAAMYDRVYSHPDFIIADVIVFFIFVGIFSLAYEFIAFITVKILEKLNIPSSEEIPSRRGGQ